jgi:hypothetical protein
LLDGKPGVGPGFPSSPLPNHHHQINNPKPHSSHFSNELFLPQISHPALLPSLKLRQAGLKTRRERRSYDVCEWPDYTFALARPSV